MWSKDICWYRGRKVATILFLVCTGGGKDICIFHLGHEAAVLLVLYVDQALCVGVTKVTFVRQSAVDLRLVERILDFIREDAGRKA